MRKKDKKQSGEIILFVIFVVLFLLLFVGLYLSRVLAKQAKIADNAASTVQAFYIADSGAEYALYRFVTYCDGTTAEKTPPACVMLPTGDYMATGGQFVTGGECDITYNEASSEISITGNYHGQTSRAIELSWTSS